MNHLGRICIVSIIVLAVGTGCKSKKQVSEEAPQNNVEQINTQNVGSNQPDNVDVGAPKDTVEAPKDTVEAPKADISVIPAKRLKLADLKPIVQKVHVEDEMGNSKATKPNAEFPAIYNNTNGEEDDHSLYFEGKGYFSGLAGEFYKALSKPALTGPVFLTKNITIEELKSSEDGTTFIMHVGKGDGFDEAFDLGVTIDTIYDNNNKNIGWKYHSQKIGGSESIQKADTDILIYQFGPVQSLIEYRSVYQAPMINSENARQGMSALFDHWEQLSKKYVEEFYRKEAALDPNAKRCEKWGSNPLFVDGSTFVYEVEDSHTVSILQQDDVLCDDNTDDNCWNCENKEEREDCTRTNSYDFTCKASLIEAESNYCMTKLACEAAIDDVYFFDSGSANSLPIGLWAIDSNGIYYFEEYFEDYDKIDMTKQPKPGNCKKTKYIKCKPGTLAYEYTLFSDKTPLISFTKEMSGSDDDERFISSLSVTHEGTIWTREDSASGPDDFWGGITIDETRGIIGFKGGFAGGSESESIARLKSPDEDNDDEDEDVSANLK